MRNPSELIPLRLSSEESLSEVHAIAPVARAMSSLSLTGLGQRTAG
jgi:hypothetical protein